jgi:hypothetical protein
MNIKNKGGKKMKSQKLIVSIAIVFLLASTSGAMADADCQGGVLEGTELDPLVIDGDLVIDGQSCFINNALIRGDVTVTNSENLTMIDNVVEGNLHVSRGREAVILGNTIGIVEGELATNSNLVIKRNERVWMLLNIVTGSARVNRNSKVDVKKNAVTFILLCVGNRRLDSFQNEVGGEEFCR